VNSLVRAPEPQRLDLTEHHGGAVLRLPMRLPIYRTHDVNAGGVAGMGPPRLDGQDRDWPKDDAQVLVHGLMAVGTHYLARPDLLAASPRQAAAPALVRWGFDADFIYLFARCPQDAVSDDRTTDWPVVDGRWWGSDALQVQLADVDGKNPRVVQVAFTPGGVVLVKSGLVTRTPQGQARVDWRDGAPAGAAAGAGVKYGIAVERQEGRVTGYTVEAAIPRAWAPGIAAGGRAPAWRVNVLRHRAGDLASTSWSGPVINDDDLAMMGLLIGE
jgi:hypothetical protein